MFVIFGPKRFACAQGPKCSLVLLVKLNRVVLLVFHKLKSPEILDQNWSCSCLKPNSGSQKQLIRQSRWPVEVELEQPKFWSYFSEIEIQIKLLPLFGFVSINVKAL